MPTRIIRNISTGKSTTRLKVTASNKVVLSQSAQYSQLLYKASHRAAQYHLNAHVKFNSSTHDGVQLVAYLAKNNKEIIHTTNCTFNIYAVDLANWNETLLVTKTGVVQSDGKFTATALDSELSGFDNDGEKTILIEVELFRFNKSFKMRKYANHIGIWDSHFRLKQRVEFMDLEKLDSGDSVI